MMLDFGEESFESESHEGERARGDIPYSDFPSGGGKIKGVELKSSITKGAKEWTGGILVYIRIKDT